MCENKIMDMEKRINVLKESRPKDHKAVKHSLESVEVSEQKKMTNNVLSTDENRTFSISRI